jgi:hypothetical protein
MKNLEDAFNAVKKNNGFTYSLNRYAYKKGYACAINKELERYYDFNDKENFDANLKAFIFANIDILADTNKGLGLGCWLNSENNKVYFDIIEIFEDRKEAINKGVERNQIAIFDLNNLQIIKV